MKIHLSQPIKCKNLAMEIIIYKEFNNSIIPRQGDYIEDGLWKSPCKVNRVIIDYPEDTCYVELEQFEPEIDRIEDFTIMVRHHKWHTYI